MTTPNLVLPLPSRCFNFYLTREFVGLYLYKMNANNDRSLMAEDDKIPTASPLPPPLLKILEDMLHNKTIQKKEQIHKTKNIAENDKLSIEIDTLHWVLSQCLSIRRLLKGQQSELNYDTTITNRLMMKG